MANYIQYTGGRLEIAPPVKLYYPTITLTQTPIFHPGDRNGNRIYTVQKVWTIRGYIIAIPGTDLQSLIAIYQNTLSTSQGNLTYCNNGVIQKLAGSLSDIGYGPIPGTATITSAGNKLASVTWSLATEEIKAQDPEKALSVTENLPIVYTISTSLDADMRSTRVITGVLKLPLRNAGAESVFNPDSYRLFVDNNCKVPQGWQRTARQFSVSEDRLSLAFSFTDQELALVLPAGITSGEVTCSYSESRANPLASHNLRGWFSCPWTALPYQNFLEGGLQKNISSSALSLKNAVISTLAGFVSYLNTQQKNWQIDSWDFNYNPHQKRIDFQVLIVAEKTTHGFPRTGKSDEGNQLTELALKQVIDASETWLAKQQLTLNFTSYDLGPYGTAQVSGPCGSGLRNDNFTGGQGRLENKQVPAAITTDWASWQAQYITAHKLKKPSTQTQGINKKVVADGPNLNAARSSEEAIIAYARTATEFVWDPGTAIIPLAGEGYHVQVIRKQNAVMHVVFSRITYGRQGDIPAPPYPLTTGAPVTDESGIQWGTIVAAKMKVFPPYPTPDDAQRILIEYYILMSPDSWGGISATTQPDENGVLPAPSGPNATTQPDIPIAQNSDPENEETTTSRERIYAGIPFEKLQFTDEAGNILAQATPTVAPRKK